MILCSMNNKKLLSNESKIREMEIEDIALMKSKK